jgi:organic radical activating enzyme
MKKYPINELFFSFQGEGVHMGRSAFFIRTNGCPVGCLWCDSAQTWHKNYLTKGRQLYAEEIIAEIGEACPEFLVMTGGEPALHNWENFNSIYPLHIETCGAFEIKGSFDWVTVSPKTEKPPTIENVKRADEIKIVVEDERSILKWENMIQEHNPNVPVWLTPEWGCRNDPKTLGVIVDFVKHAFALNYRAGFQLHKLFKADSFDNRTVPTVPLGGNPVRGSSI